MKSKLLKIGVIIIVVIILLTIAMLITDIIMIETDRKPVFARYVTAYLDGGTTVYMGFGYKIIDYNVLEGYKGYKVGPWFMKYDSSL